MVEGGGASVARCVEPGGFVEREAGVSSDLDFFFGCGSTTVRLLCFDRTGTGTVVHDEGL